MIEYKQELLCNDTGSYTLLTIHHLEVYQLHETAEEGGSGSCTVKMNYANWDELKCVNYVTKVGIIVMLRVYILV